MHKPLGQNTPSEMMTRLSEPSIYARSIFGRVPADEMPLPDYTKFSLLEF